MPTEPQPMPEVPSSLSDPIAEPSVVAKPALIAPLWHTLLIVALIFINSFAGSSKLGTVHGSASRILLYGGTVITQLVLILLVWFGIRLRGVRMRDLIGGRWKTVEAFLLDVGLAAAFFVVACIFVYRSFYGMRIQVETEEGQRKAVAA